MDEFNNLNNMQEDSDIENGKGKDLVHSENVETEKAQQILTAPYLSGVPVVKDESRNDIKKFIIIMCFVCAFVGGITGGVITGFFMRDKNDSKDENVQPTSAVYQNTTETEEKDETTTASAADSTTAVAVEINNEEAIQSGTFTSSDDKPSEDKVYTAKEIYENNVESVVSIEVRSAYNVGYGTGFIISEEGYIVTNYHVVDGADECYVSLYDDSQYTAKIVGYEESNDIAVIKIEPKGEIHSLVYGNSSELSVGDPVYVIGNPLGDLTFTLTDGVVSALNRLIETEESVTINMFQTNAAVNSGNSGGPVFDEHGYVVGIASAKYASSSIEGLSFCIPIDDVRSMIDEIINIGYVSGKPLLGVSVCDREVANYGFIQSTRSINGAKIVAVGTGTAAEKYGLQTGDIIIRANGETVSSVSGLKTILSEFRSGDKINMTVSRNGSQTNITLVLDEYEPADPRTGYTYVYDL